MLLFIYYHSLIIIDSYHLSPRYHYPLGLILLPCLQSHKFPFAIFHFPFLHRCHSGASSLLWCHSGASSLHRCHSGASSLHRCHSGVTPVSLRCHTGVTPVSHRCHSGAGVTPVSLRCHSGVTPE